MALHHLAARRSWVLRGVIDGFSEEAWTRGFPSPSFGGFGFVVISYTDRVAAFAFLLRAGRWSQWERENISPRTFQDPGNTA